MYQGSVRWELNTNTPLPNTEALSYWYTSMDVITLQTLSPNHVSTPEITFIFEPSQVHTTSKGNPHPNPNFEEGGKSSGGIHIMF